MLGSVPPVKRTYSRRITAADAEKGGHEEERGFGEVLAVQSDPDTAVPKYTSCLATAESAKKTKITDFFRKKCVDALEAVASSPSSPTAHVAMLLQSQSLSSQPSSPQTPSLKQTFLDLGQKNLFSVQCEQCLMHYNKSFPEDIALHKRFHARWLRGFCLRTSDIGRLGLVELNPPQMDRWREFRIVHIRSFTDKTFKALDGFLSFVHTQLGAPALLLPELEAHTALLAVRVKDDKTVACALFQDHINAESVYCTKTDCDPSAIELESPSTSFSSFSSSSSSSSFSSLIGVSRLWTDESVRRRGLATLLLDLKCNGERQTIAFSQPTPSGFAFAKLYQQAFLHNRQCLIYLK